MAFEINEWSRILNPTPWGDRSQLRCTNDGEYLYISGGYHTFGAYTKVADVWRSADGVTWELRTASFGGHGTERSGHGMAYYDNKLWIIGGSNDTGFLNDIWTSSNGGSTWDYVGTTPFPARHEHTLTVHNGRLWVIGGFSDATDLLDDVWSTVNGVNWTQHADIPAARREHAAVSFLGKLIVLGGDTGAQHNTIFTTTTGSVWTSGVNAAWSARKELQAVISMDGSKMAIIGGATNTAYLNDVWESSNGTTFTKITQIAPYTARSDFSASTLGGKVFIVGGIGIAEIYSDVWSATYDRTELTGTPTTGPVMTSVEFTQDMGYAVRWLWGFGNGSTSTEPEPVHKYTAPGLYTVSLTAWDQYGNEYSDVREGYIYIYTAGQGTDGVLSGTTDMCFRVALKPHQGAGVMPVRGAGWPWPPMLAATASYIDDNNETKTLVIDSETMKVYQIGIPELWVDREGDYDEAEIECMAMLPEIASRYGPHENVRVVEIHAAMRPYDEADYRGKDGYDNEGFRDGNELKLEVYSGGEQVTPTAILKSVLRNGDYSYLKNFETKRFQQKFIHSTSGFRVTAVEVHMQELDHRTAPQLNAIPERTWQKEFSLPDLWLTRKTFGTNRADGIEWTGDFVYAAGPDGKSTSGIVTDGISGVLPYVAGDFTLSAWAIGNATLLTGAVSGGGTFTIRVLSGHLLITDGTNTIDHTLISNSSWRHITVVREVGNIYVYEAGLLRAEYPVTVRSYGGACSAVGSLFDLRRHPDDISAEAIIDYYNSVLDGGGGYLP